MRQIGLNGHIGHKIKLLPDLGRVQDFETNFRVRILDFETNFRVRILDFETNFRVWILDFETNFRVGPYRLHDWPLIAQSTPLNQLANHSVVLRQAHGSYLPSCVPL